MPNLRLWVKIFQEDYIETNDLFSLEILVFSLPKNVGTRAKRSIPEKGESQWVKPGRGITPQGCWC